ncbi:MAG: chemotaxis protein CheX [Planctomycetota bacterium]
MNAIPFSMTSPPEVRDAFSISAINALREMMQLDSYAHHDMTEHTVKTDADLIVAAIQLARTKPGELRLVLSDELALQFAAKYLGDDVELSAEMADDLAGELANVIAGQAKTMLKGSDYHFLMTSPVVTRVSGYPGTIPLSIIECEYGTFFMELQLERCPGS